MILGVDRLAGELERRRLPRLPRLLGADAELVQDLLLAWAGLVLHLHVGVEGDERAVLELSERVDLRERHVVAQEQARELGEDRSEAIERRAGDPERRDHLLGLPVRERPDGREVGSGDAVGVLLGHLLDVDPAHVREQHHRLLADAVPDDAGVILVLDRRAQVDEHATWHVSADLQIEHMLGVVGRFVGRLRELHAAGLHPSAGQYLGLDHDRAGDLLGDRASLEDGRREAVPGDRDSGLGNDRPRFVLEEAHGAPEPYKSVRAKGCSRAHRSESGTAACGAQRVTQASGSSASLRTCAGRLSAARSASETCSSTPRRLARTAIQTLVSGSAAPV